MEHSPRPGSDRLAKYAMRCFFARFLSAQVSGPPFNKTRSPPTLLGLSDSCGPWTWNSFTALPPRPLWPAWLLLLSSLTASASMSTVCSSTRWPNFPARGSQPSHPGTRPTTRLSRTGSTRRRSRSCTITMVCLSSNCVYVRGRRRALAHACLKGPIIRVTPHELHIRDPRFFDEIYPKNVHLDKEGWDNRFGTENGVLPTFDAAVHKRRRAALAPMYVFPFSFPRP